MVIRRIHVGSAAKIAGVVYACLGLFVGLMIAGISLIGAGLMSQAAEQGDVPAFMGAFFGVGAIVIGPIFYGILGAVMTALLAAIYTAVAAAVGGLQIDTD